MKVVLDIETIQPPREEWARLMGHLPTDSGAEPVDRGYDLFTAGESEAQQRAEDELYAKSAFDGTYSRIVCIGLLEFSDQMEPRGTSARSRFWTVMPPTGAGSPRAIHYT